jgi:hypothetical protein
MPKADFKNVSSDWFRASEAAGDCMNIRYGRIRKGSDQVEWRFVSHCECDGIGGFGRLLRQQGIHLPHLPETKHSERRFLRPLWNRWKDRNHPKPCANRTDWKPQTNPENSEPSVGWKLFSEEETRHIVDQCRGLKVTVNSYLLKQLDRAARPEIRRPSEALSWMVPVNLRGDVKYADDTANHVSCIEPHITEDDTPQSIQHQILHRLHRGEHRANFLLLSLGCLLSHAVKVKLLRIDRSKPEGNIGAFSNLGVWKINPDPTEDEGWVFCPPRVAGQLLGAGCVTFNGRLGICIQGASAEQIMHRWIEHIR